MQEKLGLSSLNKMSCNGARQLHQGKCPGPRQARGLLLGAILAGARSSTKNKSGPKDRALCGLRHEVSVTKRAESMPTDGSLKAGWLEVYFSSLSLGKRGREESSSDADGRRCAWMHRVPQLSVLSPGECRMPRRWRERLSANTPQSDGQGLSSFSWQITQQGLTHHGVLSCFSSCFLSRELSYLSLGCSRDRIGRPRPSASAGFPALLAEFLRFCLYRMGEAAQAQMGRSMPTRVLCCSDAHLSTANCCDSC